MENFYSHDDLNYAKINVIVSNLKSIEKEHFYNLLFRYIKSIYRNLIQFKKSFDFINQYYIYNPSEIYKILDVYDKTIVKKLLAKLSMTKKALSKYDNLKDYNLYISGVLCNKYIIDIAILFNVKFIKNGNIIYNYQTLVRKIFNDYFNLKIKCRELFVKRITN